MQRARVLIAGMPGMLADIVRETIDGAGDMTVVEDVAGDGKGIEAAVERTGADVVVLGADHPEVAKEPPPALARRAQALSLLAVGSDGRESVLYTLQPVRRALGELSPERLLTAIRQRGAAGAALPENPPERAD